MDNQDKTSSTQPKKGSSFKRSVLWLLVLGVIGGSGYVAYDQGALDRYLPQMLQAKPAVEPAAPAVSTGAAADNKTPPAVATDPATGASPNDLQSALMQQMQQQNAAKDPTKDNTAAASTGAANALTGNAAASTMAPVLLSINGASANALLTAYDAQWQWSNIQQTYTQHADSALALQDLKNLKAQLQASNEPAFAPALSALAQTETQLQAWATVPSSTYLTALQQSITAVDQMNVKAKEDSNAAASANPSWWERIVASLKNVVEVKQLDGAKEAQMLSPAIAAVVKQSISARLLSAQWAAQTGQWGSAQSNAAAAKVMATQWADPAALTPLQGLIDHASFPATPDFSAVATALQQARAQLLSTARAQQNAPAAPAPATPSAPAGAAPSAIQKGGA